MPVSLARALHFADRAKAFGRIQWMLTSAALIGCTPGADPAVAVDKRSSQQVAVDRTGVQPVPPKPAESTDRPDGGKLSIRLQDGRAIALSGFRVEGPQGLSRARCGVIINGRRVLTMGVDDTETYTCDGLAAAGVVPASEGVQRIGLIYDVSSPNARFRTAVVLRGDAGWQVDPAFTGRFDDVAAGRTLAGLRAALK